MRVSFDIDLGPEVADFTAKLAGFAGVSVEEAGGRIIKAWFEVPVESKQSDFLSLANVLVMFPEIRQGMVDRGYDPDEVIKDQRSAADALSKLRHPHWHDAN